jgi:hypothetical protein
MIKIEIHHYCLFTGSINFIRIKGRFIFNKPELFRVLLRNGSVKATPVTTVTNPLSFYLYPELKHILVAVNK